MPHESLSEAVQIMWDRDCGFVPVIDDDRHVVGVVTDRDICIACWSHGARPGDLTVKDTMSSDVKTCRPDDTVTVAENVMETHKVRRLPVVDAHDRLEGVISLNDIAREAERERTHDPKKRAIRSAEVLEALAAICQPRGARRAQQPRST
jgi:CBS domain-containing protein